MANGLNFHEEFRNDAPPAFGSNRTFGFVFTALFAIVGLWPLLGSSKPHQWVLIAAVIFLVVTIVLPRALAPLHWLWQRLGLLLHKITNPVLLGLIFFGAVVPTGLVMRALGKRPLRLAFDPEAKSYWILREPPGPSPNSMKKQF